MTFTSSVSGTHTYRGNSEVNFFLDEEEALTVTIDTERLHIRSITGSVEDCGVYADLFGDPDVMGKYATGETKTRDEMEARVKGLWVKRWHQKDPYSGLAAFKTDTDEFLGHVVLGHGDLPGESELAYLFDKRHWGCRFGTEAVTAVVKEYAPATIQEGYTLEGKTLKTIKATARPDNPGSVKILEGLKMNKIGEGESHGALRYQFSIEVTELNSSI